MSPLVVLVVAAAGAVGAMARHTLDVFVLRLLQGRYPGGTLAVNTLGSFALGLLVGVTGHSDPDRMLHAALGAGLLGGFTTFSTWAVEAVRLAERRRYAGAAFHLIGGVGLGVLAAAGGVVLGSAL